MASVEMLLGLMNRSQEMPNMTKRLEDKTHATGQEPEGLQDD